MPFGQDRRELRQTFAAAWEKHQLGVVLEPLERIIVDIVAAHPEYHGALGDDDRDYVPELGETNPFLHMGMHIAIREQVGADRPAGVRVLFAELRTHFGGDEHRLEHAMMECLGQSLWQAQRSGTEPDEGAYIACLRALLQSPPSS